MEDITIHTAPKLNLTHSEEQWSRTESIIPTGTQTFSKAPFQHVNGVSPKFLAKAKGCHAWDIDGNQYIDYMLGLGPVILGHANETVNKAIFNVLNEGHSLSLPHPLESQLASLLCKLIPAAEMVRFGKNGSDATAGAVRAARAITGRSKIACCGYHGWQDWYIGSTGRDLGVPDEVKLLTLKFEYNNLASLEKIFRENPGQIAAVIMEPVNFYEPKDNFIKKVQDLAHENDSLFILDEIITGFRMHIGGAQAYYDLEPDLSCFGKAMGNGMPISAVVGKKKYMKVFDDIFFSFTFGGELASIAASIATIKTLIETDGLLHINNMGEKLKLGFNNLIDNLDLTEHAKMIGFNWWPEYLFFNNQGSSSREIQSLFQQEIVRRGILTRAGMMISTSHQSSDIDLTLNIFEDALTVVKEAIRQNKVLEWLDGDVIQPVIRPKN